MGKQSQKDFVKNEIKIHGFITRNKCLRNYISRLSDIIFRLKQEGFEFETKFVENKTAYGSTENDFIYIWINKQKGDIKTVFCFKWFDLFDEENIKEIEAENFENACLIFLSQVPIFLESISGEVISKIGSSHQLNKNNFKEFKIK